MTLEFMLVCISDLYVFLTVTTLSDPSWRLCGSRVSNSGPGGTYCDLLLFGASCITLVEGGNSIRLLCQSS